MLSALHSDPAYVLVPRSPQVSDPPKGLSEIPVRMNPNLVPASMEPVIKEPPAETCGLAEQLFPTPILDNCELFAYSPSTSVTSIGQFVEVRPPARLAQESLVFTVDPPLPKGISIGRHSGFIQGMAMEPRPNLTAYFVRAYKPGSPVVVKSSVVNLAFLDDPVHVNPATGDFIPGEAMKQDKSSGMFFRPAPVSGA